MDKKTVIGQLALIIVFLSAIQSLRAVFVKLVLPLIGTSVSNIDILNMIFMVVFTFIFLIIIHKLKIDISLFPARKKGTVTTRYFLITVFIILLIFTQPVFSGSLSVNLILTTLFSSVITPVFEEIIFRGYLWKRLGGYIKSDLKIYIVTTLLFAGWHLGYMDTVAVKTLLHGGSISLSFVMLMKVLTGLGFGVLIGFVRYKTKNCYAAILLHSFMNIFGR